MRPDRNMIFVLLGLLIVLGVPFIFRPDTAKPTPGSLSLIIITPHNEQIRSEFSIAFNRWYEKHHGQPVIIDWRTPGGTSEIRKQLMAEYESAAKHGTLGSMSYDLMFGGGSYEHWQIARGRSVTNSEGEKTPYTISTSVDFSTEQLDNWYGPNEIGRNNLYDPDLHWFGTALSAFGIVFNRDVLKDIGVPEPTTWADLTNPKFFGWVALADPGQSGSICTTYEVILQRRGWNEGWRILQEAAANSRYFANSSSKIPIDVSIGEAASGLCIDFYGRYQAQSIADAGDGDRVGYVDPPLATDIDPDPVSMLTGAPHPELARQFIEFCLSEPGQSLWQFPTHETSDKQDQQAIMGPAEFELRRMPVRRVMYEKYADRFVDQVDPFKLARTFPNWDRNLRRYISPIFSAMAIDNHDYIKEAWEAIINAENEYQDTTEMLALFHTLPQIKLTTDDIAWIIERGPSAFGSDRYIAGLSQLAQASTINTDTRSKLSELITLLNLGDTTADKDRDRIVALQQEIAGNSAMKSPQMLEAMITVFFEGRDALDLSRPEDRLAAKHRWKARPRTKDTDRIDWTKMFRRNYKRIVEMAE